MLIAHHDSTLPEVSAFFGFFDGGEPEASDLAYRVESGTAIFEVRGALVQHRRRGGRLDCTAYPEVIAALRRAEGDAAVERIVMDVAGPGGMVDGVVEAAAAVAGCSKRVTAYCSGMTASALVWLISGADRIIAAPQAMYGSIGCVAFCVDTAGADERWGVKRVTVRSHQTPKKAPEFGSEAHLAQLQTAVNTTADLFLGWIRDKRGLQNPAIAAQHGDVVPAAAALEAGLIDEIGLFAEALTAEENGMTPEDQIAELEEKNAELQRQLDEAQAAKADDDGADDEAQSKDGVDGSDDVEARVEAALKVAIEAVERKHKADLDAVRSEALKAQAGQKFAELVAARKAREPERKRFMRDFLMANAEGATDDDKAIFAEYEAREPFASTKRTSHGGTQAGDADPMSPVRVQALADEKFDGNYGQAVVHLAAQMGLR